MENKFYKLSYTEGLEADWTEDMDTEQVLCPKVPDHMRAGKRIGNLQVVLPVRAAKKDFIWTWLSDCLITDHVLNVFRETKVTGFEVYPVDKVIFRKKTDISPPKLWELKVTGWGGVIPGVEVSEYCPDCNSLRYKVVEKAQKLMDGSQWDGSDFFMLWPLPVFKFMTERVKKLIQKHKFSGMKIIPIEKLDFEIGKILIPGILSECMPESRAKELEKKSGIIYEVKQS